jgi:hypothetical protein
VNAENDIECASWYGAAERCDCAQNAEEDPDQELESADDVDDSIRGSELGGSTRIQVEDEREGNEVDLIRRRWRIGPRSYGANGQG